MKIDGLNFYKSEIVENPFNDSLFLKQGNSYERLRYKDILYFEADSSYTKIHMSDKFYTDRKILLEFESKIIDKGFLRIHRSFIINLRHVSQIKNDSVVVEELVLPLGRTYKEDLMNLI